MQVPFDYMSSGTASAIVPSAVCDLQFRGSALAEFRNPPLKGGPRPGLHDRELRIQAWPHACMVHPRYHSLRRCVCMSRKIAACDIVTQMQRRCLRKRMTSDVHAHNGGIIIVQSDRSLKAASRVTHLGKLDSSGRAREPVCMWSADGRRIVCASTHIYI